MKATHGQGDGQENEAPPETQHEAHGTDHSGHGNGHGDHAAAFRDRFAVTALLTVPILLCHLTCRTCSG